jgi:hypothetical protein
MTANLKSEQIRALFERLAMDSSTLSWRTWSPVPSNN